MAEHLVPDELWMFINPLLPPEPPSPTVAGRGFLTGRHSQALSTFSRAVRAASRTGQSRTDRLVEG